MSDSETRQMVLLRPLERLGLEGQWQQMRSGTEHRPSSPPGRSAGARSPMRRLAARGDDRRRHFPEGTLLPPERELMKMFGLGRASIREALYALAGWVSSRCAPASGRWSPGPPPQNLITELSGAARHFLAGSGGPEHFQEARALFEVGVARLATLRASSEDIERLRRARWPPMQRRAATCARFERTDVAFHYVLALITQNPILWPFMTLWSNGSRANGPSRLRAPGAEEAAFDSHRADIRGRRGE